MIRFDNDYAEGAHGRILERIVQTNEEQTPGYSTDIYCERARGLIRKACHAEQADVHFLVGGTQTNTTVISSILRPHQGAVAAVSGHIATLETGAIEATGHKVLTLPSDDGKLKAEQIRELHMTHWNSGNREHMVQPGLVYISHPTEYGTTYSLSELEELSRACRECGLPLFMDGARLGYGLVSEGSDLNLADIARLCDAFYIGGTKLGALFGEAVVIVNDGLKQGFRYQIKQRGGLLAKGRLLGIQFETMFEDGLYYDVSRHAVRMATDIRNAFVLNGFGMRYNSGTNQLFPILPNNVFETLSQTYSFSVSEKLGDTHTVVRICTSWATKKEHVDMLTDDIQRIQLASAHLSYTSA